MRKNRPTQIQIRETPRKSAVGAFRPIVLLQKAEGDQSKCPRFSDSKREKEGGREREKVVRIWIPDLVLQNAEIEEFGVESIVDWLSALTWSGLVLGA